METDRWGILFCPRRGIMSDSEGRKRKLEKILRREHVLYDIFESEAPSFVTGHCRRMIADGYRTIVIVGGDSALNDAVNVFMHADKAVRKNITLGIIPNGVMNDFAQYWGMENENLEENVLQLKMHRQRPVDVGCIHYTNGKGERCHRYFINCINIGLIASIQNLRSRTKHFFGSRGLSFLFSFILLLFKRMDFEMRFRIGTKDFCRRVMTICVGNCSGYGQTPEAVPYNGSLDVSVVNRPVVAKLLSGLYLFFKGKLLNHTNVSSFRVSHLDFIAIDGALVSVDGRMMRHTPRGEFTIDIEKEAINFLIPE